MLTCRGDPYVWRRLGLRADYRGHLTKRYALRLGTGAAAEVEIDTAFGDAVDGADGVGCRPAKVGVVRQVSQHQGCSAVRVVLTKNPAVNRAIATIPEQDWIRCTTRARSSIPPPAS